MNYKELIEELREERIYADYAPDDASVLNEGADGDRILDELFDKHD